MIKFFVRTMRAWRKYRSQRKRMTRKFCPDRFNRNLTRTTQDRTVA